MDDADRESIETLRAHCTQSPGRAEPRVDLARALLRAHRAAEAVIPIEQAVALAPQLAEAAAVRDRAITDAADYMRDLGRVMMGPDDAA